MPRKNRAGRPLERRETTAPVRLPQAASSCQTTGVDRIPHENRSPGVEISLQVRTETVIVTNESSSLHLKFLACGIILMTDAKAPSLATDRALRASRVSAGALGRFRLLLPLVALLTGCGLPTFQELMGQKKEAPPPQAAAPAPTPAPVEAPAPPPKPNAKAIIEGFKKTSPQNVTDGDLVALANLEEGLEELTELRLDASKVTKAGLQNLEKMQGLQTVSLSAMRLEPDSLAPLGTLPQLETLYLSNVPATGGLSHLAGLQYLKRLFLSDVNLSPTDWGDLDKLRNLEQLMLERTNASDATMVHLKNLKHLKHLDLLQTQVSDASCAVFGSLPELENLNLGYCRITGLGIKLLRSAPLKLLNLGHTPLDDYRNFNGWGKLEKLYLVGTPCTDVGLSHLKGCKGLTDLRLTDTQVAGQALVVLKGAKDLEYLDLVGTRVTDGAMGHLTGCKMLRELHLERTACTARGAAVVHKAVPEVKIYLPNGPYQP